MKPRHQGDTLLAGFSFTVPISACNVLPDPELFAAFSRADYEYPAFRYSVLPGRAEKVPQNGSTAHPE